MKNKNIVEIYDEYGEKYTWKQYYDKVYNHSQLEYTGVCEGDCG